MRKSTLFVSAALTTFLLVMLFGVVSAYQAVTKTNPVNVSNAAPVAQQQPVSSVVEPAPTSAPTSQAAPVTPEQASQLAAQVIGRSDLYSVETSKLNGVDAYLVTFSSGDLVYVSLTGQILSITQLPTTFSANAPSGGGNIGGGSGSRHEGGSEREGGDD
jgi:hypothetical protein